MAEPISGEDFWRVFGAIERQHQLILHPMWERHCLEEAKAGRRPTFQSFMDKMDRFLRSAAMGNGDSDPRAIAWRAFREARTTLLMAQAPHLLPGGPIIDGEAQAPPEVAGPVQTLEGPSPRKRPTAAQDAILRAYYQRSDVPDGQERQWGHYSSLQATGEIVGGFVFQTLNSFVVAIRRLGLTRKSGNPRLNSRTF